MPLLNINLQNSARQSEIATDFTVANCVFFSNCLNNIFAEVIAFKLNTLSL